ncbi:MAG: hypothetical protein KR126chlam5_00609, partial [Candidatus Anoxychlamydiales bacterium]|nr:hypothetical protein [Candidatus Anoxychlamydiales bacterium]
IPYAIHSFHMIGSKKGFRKEICSNTERQRLNILGAVDFIEKKLHFQEEPILNAQATISFLDNARYYKNQAIKKTI